LVGTGVGGYGALRSLSGDNALTLKYGGGSSGPGLAIDGDATIGVDAGTLTVTGFYHDSGSFGINKVGPGTLVLTQGSTYTGATVVSAGTLSLGNGTSPIGLCDTANVIVAAGAMLNLNFTGTDQIGGLWVDGLQMQPGVYSSTSGFITGTGTLTVTTGPVSADYATWSGRGIHDLAGAPSDDDDQDGIANLLEYVLGGNPRATSSGILPFATVSAGNLVFTFRRVHSTIADTIQIFQHGTDLSSWTEVPIVAGGIVAIQPDTPQVGTDTVTITVPEGTAPRIFGRLKVTKP
jgi:autotransporter-associated beta strand protein